MWSSQMEILVDDVVVNSGNDIEVGLPAAIDVTKDKEDYEVTFAKREYTITGDSIVIPTIYDDDDAPPWLKDLLDKTIAVAIDRLDKTIAVDADRRDQSIVDRMQAILTAVEFVPMNQYSEQIYQIIGEDGIINQRIAALNSNLTDALNSTNATIATINTTYATKEEAGTIASNIVTASVSESGEIGSKIVDLQEAYATLSASTAQELEVMEASFGAYASGTLTELESVKATIDGVEAKFSYDSELKLNGTTYTSGYGLATSLTENSGIPVGSSEFWVKADKFRLVSSSGIKSSYSPFLVDATTGDINFNGKVSFENITDTPTINKTYIQAEAPFENLNIGDVWIDEDDGNAIHTYDGTSWVMSATGINTYLQNDAPTIGMVAGDIWVDSNDNYKQYRYNGASWVAFDFDPAALINIKNTTINGGKIEANSISASKISSYNLTSSNATIGNALIDTAHIKDLSVDTVKIKNGAVSSMVAATGYAILSKDSNGSSATALSIATLSYAYSGTGSVSLLVDFYGLNVGSSTCEVVFFLERNGSMLYFPYGSEAFRLFSGYSSSYSFNILDNPSYAGVYTYTLKMYVISSMADIKRASIIAIGIKK